MLFMLAGLLQLSDTYRMVGLSSPRISPDGKALAFVRSTIDLAKDRWDGEIVLLRIATDTQERLVAAKPGLSDPQWSPSGGRMAFVAEDAHRHEQVWVLRLGRSQPRRVTDAPEGVSQYLWRPDGEAIAYVTPDPVPKRTGIARWRDAFRVTENAYLDPGPDPPSHLWWTQRKKGRWFAAQRLTQGSWSVAAGDAASTLSWSRGGTTIAYVRLPNALLGDADRSIVERLNVASRVSTPLTGRTKFEFNPQISPNGRYTSYTYAHDGDPMQEADIFLSRGAGPGRDVSTAIGANTTNYAWYPDSTALLVEANRGTHHALWRLGIDGRARRLKTGAVNPLGNFQGSISRSGAVAFVGTTASRPGEIYYLSASGKLKRLTDYNAWIAAKHLGRVRTLTWKGPDGFFEDGVLTYPARYAAGRTYPLVLLIHGGPTGASSTTFDTLAQLMAARGWFVLEPNYRGSDNLGNAYQRAIYKDPTVGPGRDILAGVKAAESLPGIDRRRICVSGWSYGGMMTSWLITQDHRWACAVSGAAVDDLVYDYSLADDISADRESMGGPPFTGGRLAAYRAASPLDHVQSVTTPTLILSDMYDVRVPAAQSYAFYHALHERGTPVEFYQWPIRAHFPSDPVRIADVYRYWIRWIARYVTAPR
ncbi:MAG: S9 family peptidase [Vulcanimicrobiaceae bacterium]